MKVTRLDFGAEFACISTARATAFRSAIEIVDTLPKATCRRLLKSLMRNEAKMACEFAKRAASRRCKESTP